MNRDEIKGKLIEVLKGHRHKNYDRTVEHAKWCRQIVTGEDQDELIVSYKIRETEDQKKQRIHITNTRTKYVSGRIIQSFSEVEKTDVLVDNIVYTNKEDKGAAEAKELTMSLSKWEGGKGVERYIFDRMKLLEFIDPNAFIILEFENYDPLKEKPKVYPIEIYAEDAVDFDIIHGNLQYVTGRWPHDVTIIKDGETKVKTEHKFTCYLADWVFDAIPCDMKDDKPIYKEGYSILNVTLKDDKKLYFYYKEYNSKSKVCPAIRVGYLPDPTNLGQTCVSILDRGSNIFQDLINTKSEYDLSKALHGFIQKIQYAPKCDYKTNEDRCSGGLLSFSGEKCPACKGDGTISHTSVQDIVYIRKPDGKEEHIPLSEMIHYVQVPEYIIKNQRDELEGLEKKAALAIFNTNVFDKSEIYRNVTATEKNLDKSAWNNVLAEYGRQYSAIWEFIHKITAIHLQIDEGLEVQHAFPSDFKLETLEELLLQRKSAIDANAPYYVIDRIDQAIAIKQNQDNPDYLAFLSSREKFRPWKEKSREERAMLATGLPKNNRNVLLWQNFEEIFTDIFNLESKFHNMNYEKQKEILNRYLEPYLKAANEEIEANKAFALPGSDEEE